jgi:hypothetical protein
MQIFISFASEQRETAELVAVVLRERGYQVFFSRDTLPAAESFDVRIEKAVKSSDLFIFLVSPESVTKGKYTLTELSFAREKWSSPSGHVLPVMIAPTPISAIPVYLRSVSIFEPEGSVATDIAVQADKVLRQTSRSIARFVALAGVGTGLLSYLCLRYFPSFLQVSFYHFRSVIIDGVNGQPSTNTTAVSLLPGLLFGALIAFTNWKFALRDKFQLGLIVLVTTLSWVLAYNTTSLIAQKISQYTRVIPAAAGAPGDATPDATASGIASNPDDPEMGSGAPPSLPNTETLPFAGGLSGMVGGLIGGLGTLLGVAIVNSRVRRLEKILPILVAATLIGFLVELALQRDWYGVAGYILLLVCWQGAVAGMITRVLCLAEATPE